MFCWFVLGLCCRIAGCVCIVRGCGFCRFWMVCFGFLVGLVLLLFLSCWCDGGNGVIDGNGVSVMVIGDGDGSVLHEGDFMLDLTSRIQLSPKVDATEGCMMPPLRGSQLTQAKN